MAFNSSIFSFHILYFPCIALTCSLLYVLCKRWYSGRCLSHIPGPARHSWLSGNLNQLFSAEGWDFHSEIVRNYGGAVKVHGLLGDEQLYVSDPLALQHVVSTDQSFYEPTPAFLVSNHIIFGQALSATTGDYHKQQRRLLHPAFATRSVRELIHVFLPILKECCTALSDVLQSGAQDIDMFRWMSCVSLECITQGMTGVTYHSFEPGMYATNKYMSAMKRLLPTYNDLSLCVTLCPYLVKLGPAWFRRMVVTLLPFKTTHKMRYIIDAMHENTTNLFKEKRNHFLPEDTSLFDGDGSRTSLISLLLHAHLTGDTSERLSEDEAISQTNLITWGGRDNTTSSLVRLLWVLAHNPAAQDQLRHELKEYRETFGHDPDYDELISLPYLDAVIKETLRLYPPLATSMRTTTKDIVLPLLHPIPADIAPNGKPIQEIHLKKGTGVILSLFAANRSKTVWGEDAEQWKPERWSGVVVDPEKTSDGYKEFVEAYSPRITKEKLPSVYAGIMTFLGGWRGCIGVKIAELELSQSKFCFTPAITDLVKELAMFMIIERFKLEPADEVFFNLSNFSFPVVRGSKDMSPQLPLKVSLVQN